MGSGFLIFKTDAFLGFVGFVGFGGFGAVTTGGADDADADDAAAILALLRDIVLFNTKQSFKVVMTPEITVVIVFCCLIGITVLCGSCFICNRYEVEAP